MKSIRIETMYEYRFLSNLRLSGNGDTAAFVLHRCRPEGDGYDSDLWLHTASGVRRLTSSADVGGYCWTDPNTIVFSSRRDKPAYGTTSYYTISTDGGEAQPAFTIPMQVSGIDPLGGGRWIVCALYDHAAPDVTGLSDEEREKKLHERDEHPDCAVFDELPFWSNGGGIVNKRRNRLYLYDEADASLKALTPPLYQTDGWSITPDHTRIVVWGQEYSDIDINRQDIREYRLDMPEPVERVLLEGGAYELFHAEVFGDGWLVLATDTLHYGINENPVLYTLDENGKLSILCGEDLSYGSSIGSDCRRGGGKNFVVSDGVIYFTVTDRTCSRICRLTETGKVEFLTQADGSIDCFDVRAGRLAFIGMRGMNLQELYERKEEGETPLTAFNTSVTEKYRIAQPQPITFIARDGLEIDGWVLAPTDDASSGEKCPAILNIHGGPKTAFGTVFFHEMQVWAAMGYYVLFCNPRGGDGRGNAFADIRGHYGEDDYRDLMEFVDHVLEAYPQIDAARLGVTGGSYGGFMTNWIIGHTRRFAAAASQRSIANWSTMETLSDIGAIFPTDQVGASTWNGFERLWEQSPLKYADQVKTPTLFIHSHEDYRCPENEGMQMFAALKYFGVPARFCLFTGENHDLSRSGMPRRRVRRLEEICGWFDMYLKHRD